MTVEHRRPTSIWRRIERWLVGIAMSMIAFILERFVLRAVRKRDAQNDAKKDKKKKDTPTTLTSKGGKVDL